MPDILHTVSVQVPPQQVFRALTARSGLRPDWARQSETSPVAGSISEFRFDEKTVVTMRIAALEGDARIAWKCVDGPSDWIDTEVSFELRPDAGGEATTVRFVHKNWKEPTDLMGRCSAKWAGILFALKSFLETPEADDVW